MWCVCELRGQKPPFHMGNISNFCISEIQKTTPTQASRSNEIDNIEMLVVFECTFGPHLVQTTIPIDNHK